MPVHSCALKGTRDLERRLADPSWIKVQTAHFSHSSAEGARRAESFAIFQGGRNVQEI